MNQILSRSVQRLEDELKELEVEPQVEKEEEETEQVEAPSSVLTKEEETFKKRYSDLRRHNQKILDDLKEAQNRIDQLERSKSGLPSPEEAAAWAKANPKAAAIIRALATEQVSTIAPKNEELLAIQNELERTKQEAKIKKVHPDFEEITADDKFHDWAETQPEGIQNLVYGGSADDVIWAINQYKKEKVNPKKEAAKAVVNKGTTVAPENTGKGRFTESMVARMSMSEYEKNAAAIQEAMANGTFVYDLSGAAR
jgi:hypothetical protein